MLKRQRSGMDRWETHASNDNPGPSLDGWLSMHGAILALVVVMGGSSSAPADPTQLVAGLGSPRFADRAAAERELGTLGRVALPALRIAETSPDPEIRVRAAALLQRIEGELLLEPTLITLDFDQIPLVNAIEAINAQSGLRLKLMPELPQIWAERRLTVHASHPLPFWQALDAICEAGQVHYVFGGQSDFDQDGTSVALFDGFAPNSGIFDEHGPFRVQLASLHYQSEVHLAGDRGVAPGLIPIGTLPAINPRQPNPATKQFFAQMLVGAEPRLSIAPAGPIRVTEAVDDQGRSLVIPAPGETIQHESGYFGINSSPLVHLRLDLMYPTGEAQRLKKVRGLIPLMVSTRKSDPLEIPLDNATDRTFRQSGVEISVGEIKLNQPDQPPTIDLKIRATGLTGRDPLAEEVDGAIRSVVSPQQLEVLDATGRMIPWFPSSSFFNGEESRLSLTLLDRGGPAVPTTLRYFAVIRDRTEIPFEFRDLPMP